VKNVAARVAATAALASIASLLFTTVSVYAGEKPGNPGHHYGEISNPGHHYGQLKHRPTSSTTTPSQTGAANSLQSDPVSGSGGASDPASTTTAGVPNLPTTLPVSNFQKAPVSARTAPVSHDWISWLVLLILPALLVVWLMVFARAALTAVRRRRVTQAA
jgi:hypothetical protein